MRYFNPIYLGHYKPGQQGSRPVWDHTKEAYFSAAFEVARTDNDEWATLLEPSTGNVWEMPLVAIDRQLDIGQARLVVDKDRIRFVLQQLKRKVAERDALLHQYPRATCIKVLIDHGAELPPPRLRRDEAAWPKNADGTPKRKEDMSAAERAQVAAATGTERAPRAVPPGLPAPPPEAAGYKGHRPGSRKEAVHRVYDEKGTEAAMADAVARGIKPVTAKNWFWYWAKQDGGTQVQSTAPAAVTKILATIKRSQRAKRVAKRALKRMGK